MALQMMELELVQARTATKEVQYNYFMQMIEMVVLMMVKVESIVFVMAVTEIENFCKILSYE